VCEWSDAIGPELRDVLAACQLPGPSARAALPALRAALQGQFHSLLGRTSHVVPPDSRRRCTGALVELAKSAAREV